jgi:uncharacterized membrane protein YphA (DoxX/SURF4 family)
MTAPGRVRDLVLAAIRVPAGAAFTATGALTLARHESWADRFEGWDVPSPDLAAWVVGGLELGAGVVLLLGLSSRLAALLLLLVMLAAVATAGRVDGGVYLVAPPLLALACLVIVARGGGAWQLLDRIDPPE